MPSTRFDLDPDRIFPDHAYAPGYEPAPRAPIAPEDREAVIASGEMLRFAFAALLVIGAIAAVASLIVAA